MDPTGLHKNTGMQGWGVSSVSSVFLPLNKWSGSTPPQVTTTLHNTQHPSTTSDPPGYTHHWRRRCCWRPPAYGPPTAAGRQGGAKWCQGSGGSRAGAQRRQGRTSMVAQRVRGSTPHSSRQPRAVCFVWNGSSQNLQDPREERGRFRQQAWCPEELCSEAPGTGSRPATDAGGSPHPTPHISRTPSLLNGMNCSVQY